MFTKILVPIDGSQHASKALDYALDIATRYTATLHILIAYTITAETLRLIQRALPRTLATSYGTNVKEQNEQILLKAVHHATTTHPHLTITHSLVQGRPADRIVEAATNGQYDLIVMGSRGIGGIKGVLLGSVADRVADHAACPVMIVK